MSNTVTLRRLLTLAALISLNVVNSACTPTSPLEQAYYSGGVSSTFPGGYTRSIFSSSNF